MRKYVHMERVKKVSMPLIVGAGLVALVAGGIFFLGGGSVGAKNLAVYADEIIAACADQEYKPSCYDEEIPKLMDYLSMEDTFAVTRLVQERDSGYWYCHVLGHNVSAREAAKDPSKWTEVIARCPAGMCSNGCLHGTFQERFRDEVLSDSEIEAIIPELQTICESGRDFTGLERASCYHALGHLTMYITGADADRASDICDRVAFHEGRDFRPLCYDGVFMQIFQPLEPEDIALVQDIAPETPAQAVEMCAQYSGSRHLSCVMESWPLYEDEIETPQGLAAFCDMLETDSGRTRCLNGLFYIVTPRLDFSLERIVPFCDALNGTTRVQCYANAASRMIETDYRLSERAIALCKAATDTRAHDRCLEELLLYSTYNFHEGSDSFLTICNAMPEPWKTRCLNKERPTASPHSYE